MRGWGGATLWGLCLLCALIFGLRNLAEARDHDLDRRFKAPVLRGDLLQRPGLEGVDGRSFLCRREGCDDQTPWPAGDDPLPWLKALGHQDASPGRGRLPSAPALVRSPEGWLVLWSERPERLEVIVQGRGAGVWPRAKFEAMGGWSWWKGLR